MPAELLIITRNFPPLVGGMEKLLAEAFRALADDYRCTVIGPRGAAARVPAPHRAIECDESGAPGFLWQAARAALRASRETEFSLVVAGSGLIGPVCLLLKLRRGLRSMVFLHGLDIVVDSLPYRLLWLPCLRRADYVVANSANTAALARRHGIRGPSTRTINPGVEVPESAPQTMPFLETLRGRPLMLSVGRLVRRKGLPEFVERSLPAIVAACPGACLLVIGDEPAGALTRERGVRARLEDAVARLQLGDSVVFHGRGSDAEVRAAYASADLFVFPLIEVHGDVEGFGMVALEAAAHGLPTVAFDCGGVGDAIAVGRTGFLVEPGDYERMTSTISEALAGDARATMAADCRRFARERDWSAFGRQLRAFVADAMAGKE